MNKYIEYVGNSASLHLFAKTKELGESDIDVIGPGGGEPDFDTPMAIKRKTINELLKGNAHYAVEKQARLFNRLPLLLLTV